LTPLVKRIQALPVLLCSSSPRRKEILSGAGFIFETFSPDVDESIPAGMPYTQLPEYLAQKKATEGRVVFPDHWIIAADTIVVLENQVLNKPLDEAEAKQMLQSLSGKTHEVITGVALYSPNGDEVASAKAQVRFRNLSEAEINFYISTGSPMDKAGAYGVQDWMGYYGIHHMEGSYYTVMGLPIHLVLEMFEKKLNA
jgi:septum formation protein